jgi:hypothetical protein
VAVRPPDEARQTERDQTGARQEFESSTTAAQPAHLQATQATLDAVDFEDVLDRLSKGVNVLIIDRD